MTHLNFRGITLVLMQVLLLAACSASNETEQQAGNPPQETAPVQQPAPAPTADPAPSPEASPPATAALREFIDPVTGQHREPTAAERKALEAAVKTGRTTAPVPPRPKDKEIILPDGTVAVEEVAPSQMQACVQKDGTVLADHDCPGTRAPVKKP